MNYDVKVNHTASIELTEKELLKIIKTLQYVYDKYSENIKAWCNNNV